MSDELTEGGSMSNGLVGFCCPRSGRKESFQFCWARCERHCKPLPVLLALAHQERGNEKNVYHVTELLTPPQQVYLKRNNPYYMKPDSLIDMNFGSSWHEKMAETKKYVGELGLQDDYLMEKNFKQYFAMSKDGMFELEHPKAIDTDKVIVLSGTFDLGVISTKTLWDYKVMKFWYQFKYLSEDKWDDSPIPWQMNIYRVYGFPIAEEMKIFCYIKDFKLNMTEKYCLNQTEELHVPRIPDRVVKNRVVELLTEHVTAQKTGTPRLCTEEERWINKDDVSLRCEHYCAVKEICEQYQHGCTKEEK